MNILINLIVKIFQAIFEEDLARRSPQDRQQAKGQRRQVTLEEWLNQVMETREGPGVERAQPDQSPGHGEKRPSRDGSPARRAYPGTAAGEKFARRNQNPDAERMPRPVPRAPVRRVRQVSAAPMLAAPKPAAPKPAAPKPAASIRHAPLRPKMVGGAAATRSSKRVGRAATPAGSLEQLILAQVILGPCKAHQRTRSIR